MIDGIVSLANDQEGYIIMVTVTVTAIEVKIIMEATQMCWQIYIINITFSLRLQESYVLGFGMLPFGLAEKQECLAKKKVLRCQPLVSLHITMKQDHCMELVE